MYVRVMVKFRVRVMCLPPRLGAKRQHCVYVYVYVYVRVRVGCSVMVVIGFGLCVPTSAG